MTFLKSIGDGNMYLGLFIDNRPNSRVDNDFQRTCNGFVLQMAHFYSKKSIVKKSLLNITK